MTDTPSSQNENIIKGYGVVVLKDDMVLLVRHLEKAGHVTGMYGLPAGRADEGETEIEAARRELFEETGLKVKSSDLTSLPKVYTADIERSDGTIRRMSVQCFLAREVSGEPSPSADEETIPEWVRIDQLDTVKLLPNVKNVVQDAIAVLKTL